MTGIQGITSDLNGLTNGYSATQAATLSHEISSFESLIDAVQRGNAAEADTMTAEGVANSFRTVTTIDAGKLNGDYKSGFGDTFTNSSDKIADPVGAAANSQSPATVGKTIDKTSKLYEQALELESYFVKIMLSSMRDTLSGTSLNGQDKSYAEKTYEDMFYDEMAVSMTKNAGFGLADQIYLELNA